MSGHGAIYDWQDLKAEDLEKALELMGKLDDLGFQCVSDEMQQSMQNELKERKTFEAKLRDALGEWHEGREVTDELIEEFFREWKKSGLSIDAWITDQLDACWDCDQDCSRCRVPAIRK